MTISLPNPTEALVDEVKKPSAVWLRFFQDLVRGLNAPGAKAAAVPYDNVASGLSATDVQAAIDELAAAPSVIASGTLSGTAVDILDIPQNFSRLWLTIAGLSFNAAACNPVLRVSTDNGANFDATAGNYVFYAWASAVATASLLVPLAHANAADQSTHMLIIDGYQTGGYPMAFGNYNLGGPGQPTWAAYFGSTAAINALRIAAQGGGSFDGGNWALLGVR
jgi:hypothetical protein